MVVDSYKPRHRHQRSRAPYEDPYPRASDYRSVGWYEGKSRNEPYWRDQERTRDGRVQKTRRHSPHLRNGREPTHTERQLKLHEDRLERSIENLGPDEGEVVEDELYRLTRPDKCTDRLPSSPEEPFQPRDSPQEVAKQVLAKWKAQDGGAPVLEQLPHWAFRIAGQFEKSYNSVLMVNFMWKAFGRVTMSQTSQLEAGMILYYLDAFTLAPNRWEVSVPKRTAEFGPDGVARVAQKGRFAILLGIRNTTLKVARLTSISGRGIECKSEAEQEQYVPFAHSGCSVSREKYPDGFPEVDWATVEFLPQTVADLNTEKISMSSQIMVAGKVTKESLEALRKLAAAQEARFE